LHFETALNLVWLVLGLVAVSSTVRVSLRESVKPKRTPAWLHIIGMGLIVAALFPYISATDDVLRVEHFSAQHDDRHPGKHSRTENLVRLYETIDNPLVCRSPEVAITVFFIFLIFTPVPRLIHRIAPLEAGRSPPALEAL
jgi:hypothetical protein